MQLLLKEARGYEQQRTLNQTEPLEKDRHNALSEQHLNPTNDLRTTDETTDVIQ